MSGSIPPRLGETLRDFRLIAGLSQEALSEASGVSVRTISDLERGQRPSAHLETVRLLARALGLTTDERRHLIESARPAGLLRAPSPAASPGTAYSSSRWAASIPEPATPLVGRVREFDALIASLTERRRGIVTLTGPGGVGKTRLAIEAAHRLAPSYADGAAVVALATVTQAELVPDAIARALGMAPGAGAVIDRLTALLASRELMLVLDNVEQVIESAPFIAQLDAACPRLTVLVTSRVRLRVSSERQIAVPPLSLPGNKAPIEQLRASDAIQFFAECARRVDPQFELSDPNVATVAGICQRLDGLPLAIELATSRLRVLPVPTLLERLDRRLPLLTGGDRDRPPRQQSMRDTIAWSYDLLDPPAKRFLRWISVFIGGLSLESAEALGHALGLNASGSLDTISSLVDCGLAVRTGLSSDQPRFHLFETIREFGLDQLAEADELDSARQFHATHFLEFASREAPRPDEPIPIAWVGRLATEYPNLLAAFDVLCVPATAEQSLQFAAAMGPYWHAHGPFSDWQPRLSRAFDFASPEPTILKTHVLFWLSLILGASPDFPAALQAAGKCIEMAGQVGTDSDRAAAIQILAWVHECHGNVDIARELREQAISLWISVGNSYMHAMCLALNGCIAYAKGELDRAQREAVQAGAMFQALDNSDWSAAVEWLQGMIAVARKRLDLGASHYEQSLRIWMQIESAPRWYRPLVGLADIAAAIGQFPAAARLLGAADEILIAGGRNLTSFDWPGYSRAETRGREALGSAEFEAHRLTGTMLTTDTRLLEASAVVDAASGPPRRSHTVTQNRA